MRRAFEEQRPAVKIFVDQGTYELEKTWRFDGRDSGLDARHRVEWTGYGDQKEMPRIVGGLRITNWVRAAQDHIWMATVKGDVMPFGQLFVNGERRTRARHPNLGDFLIWKSPLCEFKLSLGVNVP